MARIYWILRGGTFSCRVHNPKTTKKERLRRSDPNDGRKGSSLSDGFVFAVFPWVLKGALGTKSFAREGAADCGRLAARYFTRTNPRWRYDNINQSGRHRHR
jgi:hypothetical protein